MTLRTTRLIACRCAVATLLLLAGAAPATALVMETVPIGDPGNDADTTGFGAVGYAYRIGRYEVTGAQYAEFLNAVAADDLHELYNTNMTAGFGCRITRSGDPGGYTYSAAAEWVDRPVNYVSWYDCLRFANWLHNGRPAGAQDASTTEDGAYDLSLGAHVPRKPGAQVWLPSEDEWYKAAYYKGGSTAAGYWSYPTAHNDPPPAETPPGTDLVHGSANYYDGGYVDPAHGTTVVGAYSAKPSDSAYGTFDQGGNVSEWNEDEANGGVYRRIRGGSFVDLGGVVNLLSTSQAAGPPSNEAYTTGFRVAMVPEPATIALLALGGMGVLAKKRRGRG